MVLQQDSPAPALVPHRFVNTPRVLVVDDDHATRALLSQVFSATSEVITVGNGPDALRVLSEQPIDVVLLDIMMPVMSGLDVLEAIRRDETLVELPVILISARSTQKDVVEGLQRGANDYISKPIDLAVARARVNTQLKLKRLSDAYQSTIVELQSSQQLQANFVQIVSHDLKGPLTNLRMAHHLLREMLKENDSAMAVMESAELAVIEMNTLIKTFLDVAVAQNGQLEIRPDCLNVNDHLRRVVDQQALPAQRKQIEVVLEDGEYAVVADGRLFGQIVSNLLSNAIKYTPQGSLVRVWAKPIGERVRICVSDQGPGVPEAERGRLFHMFGRLSARPTGGESSTGLGLWIVKTLTEAQDGAVGVECPPEGGSIFYVDLPICALE
ncbi:MAG: hybrid sensor histidine kinase/response regulator [Anaerolineae bacterium]